MAPRGRRRQLLVRPRRREGRGRWLSRRPGAGRGRGARGRGGDSGPGLRAAAIAGDLLLVRLPADLPGIRSLTRACTYVQFSGTFVHIMLAWLYLSAAIATEVVGTVFLRYTDGFTKPAPSILVLVTYAASLWLTALALKSLEISLAYAVWAGVGTAAVAVIGMATLGESVNALKLASIALVIGGVVGLNLSGAN